FLFSLSSGCRRGWCWVFGLWGSFSAEPQPPSRTRSKPPVASPSGHTSVGLPAEPYSSSFFQHSAEDGPTTEATDLALRYRGVSAPTLPLYAGAIPNTYISAFLSGFQDWQEAPWDTMSRLAAGAWLAFYGLFLLHAFRNTSGFLLIDNANLVVHEAGHLLFGWFGGTLGLYGGTLLQLLVPFALATSFAYRKHTAGAAFCGFFFFENFLYTATYMADARVQELPLVSVGGGEAVDHDWERIFSGL